MSNLIFKEFAGIEKIANNFLDKIASAIGWVATHDTPKRHAVRTYIEEIDNSDLPPLYKAAIISRAEKDIKEYANQCKIVNGALCLLTEACEPEKLDNDWIAHFFDKTRLVSKEEFQIIWSNLLADECNSPGTVPKSLLFTLERMSKEDAEIFLRLCATAVTVFGESAPLIIDIGNDALSKVGLDYDMLVHLESLGLIKIDSTTIGGPTYCLVRDSRSNSKDVSYFENRHELPEDMDDFPVGYIIFTKDGTALFKAIEAVEIDGFWIESIEPWIEKQIEIHNQRTMVPPAFAGNKE